jgi:hypothetical protein
MALATALARDAVLLSMIMAAAHQLDSLEALTNLLYLIRPTLDDPARAEAYLDVAGQVLADIAAGLARKLLWGCRDVGAPHGVSSGW